MLHNFYWKQSLRTTSLLLHVVFGAVMSMSTVGTKGQSLGSGSLGTLNEWKTMYNTENVNYDSAALFAEVFYVGCSFRIV